MEAGKLNRPLDADPATDKVLDSPAKTRSSDNSWEDEGSPKEAPKDPNNPENRTGSGRISGSRKANRILPALRTSRRAGTSAGEIADARLAGPDAATNQRLTAVKRDFSRYILVTLNTL
jgi:hypothetical protein